MKSVAECLCIGLRTVGIIQQTSLVLSWLSCVSRGEGEAWGGRRKPGDFCITEQNVEERECC